MPPPSLAPYYLDWLAHPGYDDYWKGVAIDEHCPSSYDLGEDLRLVLISVTEGEDKPLKYPSIFNSADISIVTKMDLAEAVEFDWDAAYNNIQAVRPGMPVFQVSAKSGDGMEKFVGFLATRLAELRQAAV